MTKEQAITFHYNKAVMQAEELIEISNNIKTLVQKKLGDSICEIDRNWDGKNSQKYIQKMNSLKEKMEDSVCDVEKTAAAMKKIAKQIYDAEKKNIEIAKTS